MTILRRLSTVGFNVEAASLMVDLEYSFTEASCSLDVTEKYCGVGVNSFNPNRVAVLLSVKH